MAKWICCAEFDADHFEKKNIKYDAVEGAHLL